MATEINVEVDGVIIRDGHIKCLWQGTPGFGELDIYSNKNDLDENSFYEGETKSFEITTECMGEDFYNVILEKIIQYLKENSIIIE